MKSVIAEVREGKIALPPGVELPEGLQVRIQWDDAEAILPPLEDEPWTEEELRHDLEWAKGHQWPKQRGT